MVQDRLDLVQDCLDLVQYHLEVHDGLDRVQNYFFTSVWPINCKGIFVISRCGFVEFFPFSKLFSMV